jgi:hypothetical protein
MSSIRKDSLIWRVNKQYGDFIMKKYLPLLLSSGVIFAAPSFAEEVGQNSLRLSVGMVSSASVLEKGSEELVQSDSQVPFSAVFQFDQGLYLGYTRIKGTVDEVEINNVTFDVDEDFDADVLSIGYRMPTSTEGQYWGFGYDRSDNDDFEETVNQLSIFSEKDTDSRYGRIAVSYQDSDEISAFGISGTHVWFFDIPVGIGLNWALSAGDYDLGAVGDADYSNASFGLTVMYRTGI